MSLIAAWRNLNYLQEVDYAADPNLAKELAAALEQSALLDKLKVYLPILTGPHALGIGLANDIVSFYCEVYALESFQLAAETNFRKQPRYQLVEKPLNEKPANWLRFKMQHHLNFEVIGQSQPVEEQPEFLMTAGVAKLIQLTSNPHKTRQTLWQSRVDLVTSQSEISPDAKIILPEYQLSVRDFFELTVPHEMTLEQYLISLVEMDELELKKLIPTHLLNHSQGLSLAAGAVVPTTSLSDGGVTS